MSGRSVKYTIIDEFARNTKDWAIKYWAGEYYDNPILKGKKMAQVIEVLAIQEHTDGSPTTILVPITTVVAKDERTAVQNFLIENATELKGRDNVRTLCRPFC